MSASAMAAAQDALTWGEPDDGAIERFAVSDVDALRERLDAEVDQILHECGQEAAETIDADVTPVQLAEEAQARMPDYRRAEAEDAAGLLAFAKAARRAALYLLLAASEADAQAQAMAEYA